MADAVVQIVVAHSEAVERQMAHGTGNAVRRHYNYAQHLPVRRTMMQAWADYLDELRSSAPIRTECNRQNRLKVGANLQAT
jgi:hypothetical protein